MSARAGRSERRDPGRRTRFPRSSLRTVAAIGFEMPEQQAAEPSRRDLGEFGLGADRLGRKEKILSEALDLAGRNPVRGLGDSGCIDLPVLRDRRDRVGAKLNDVGFIEEAARLGDGRGR